MDTPNRRTFMKSTSGMLLSILAAGCAKSNDGLKGTSTSIGPPDPNSKATHTATRTPTSTPTPTPEPPKTPESCEACEPSYLQIAPGFTIKPYANNEDLGGGSWRPGPEPGPRLMATHDGVLFATIPSQGRVVALPPEKNSERASEVITVIENLDKPHGIAFHDSLIYLALENDIRRYRIDGVTIDTTSLELLVEDIPSGGFHWTRTILIQNGYLYLSAGACNPLGSDECKDGNQSYLAAITRFELDGSDPKPLATGLRNAVGIEWHDGQVIATDNGVDDLGPELPPDEVNIIRDNGHYGFPECYGNNVSVHNDSNSSNICTDRIPPAATLPAHSAPLGFDVYTGERFPPGYQGALYVALHGSWARPNPVGYKIVRIPYKSGTLGMPEDFITGWMPEDGDNTDARGRPVDVHLGYDGALYVSDDMTGVIYRVDYHGQPE